MAPTPTRTSSRRASAGAKRKNYAEDEDHGDETAASPTRKSARTRTVKSKASKKEYDSDNLDEDEDEKVKVVKNNPARKRRRVEEEEESEEEKEEGVKEGKVKALARSPRKASSRKKAKPTYDSDALDEESAQEEDKSEYDGEEDGEAKPKSKSKRTPKATKSKYFSPRKKASSSKAKDEGDDEEFDDVDLKEGQEVVGTVVQAPTTGRVPPGRISQNTLDFLTHLKDPACNDRTWFRLHEPVYRVAEKEWKDFVEKWQEELIEVDPQIPQLPTKDVIHRIYRDVSVHLGYFAASESFLRLLLIALAAPSFDYFPTCRRWGLNPTVSRSRSRRCTLVYPIVFQNHANTCLLDTFQ
ncbi:hypothetical protein CC2G_014512 [Coprinopsis cinerea AmutBmut pab1-1]|nr:hypothetical protein CC2G_014512 [Coprinopsis cinerea AmutBmut pab1-1]